MEHIVQIFNIRKGFRRVFGYLQLSLFIPSKPVTKQYNFRTVNVILAINQLIDVLENNQI